MGEVLGLLEHDEKRRKDREFADDQRRTVNYFRPKRDAAISRGEEPNKRELIFEALRFIAKVERGQPDDGPAGMKCSWMPIVRDLDERADDARQRLLEVYADEAPVAAGGWPQDVTTAECLERFPRGQTLLARTGTALGNPELSL